MEGITMWAQAVLTPVESKKLICKAVAEMDAVKNAMSKGKVIVHPSSTTYFLVEELTGKVPMTTHWVLGCVVPQGLCRGAYRKGDEYQNVAKKMGPVKDLKEMMQRFPFKWVIQDGELHAGIRLGEILENITSDDVYIKGCNALDREGNAGVLYGHGGGGTFGAVLAAEKTKGFKVILPIGLEKLIPVTIKEAALAAHRTDVELGMGMPCGLFPARGEVVTEVEAINIISGAKATPIASGGLGGAEGAVTLSIGGEEDQVRKAFDYIEQSKGAKQPKAGAEICEECKSPDCKFPIGEKYWKDAVLNI
jgi:hypothetical protein